MRSTTADKVAWSTADITDRDSIYREIEREKQRERNREKQRERSVGGLVFVWHNTPP